MKCRRCKVNEAMKGLINCERCNERNNKYTIRLIEENKLKDNNKTVNKSLNDYNVYGGLGNEWEKGVAGHLENL